MAHMIPDLDPEAIESRGERVVYTAMSELPETYTVLYGYKYYQHPMY